MGTGAWRVLLVEGAAHARVPSAVVVPPVESKYRDTCQARFHGGPDEFVASRAEKPAEVALCRALDEVSSYEDAPACDAGDLHSGAMSDPAPTLPGAGNADLLWLIFPSGDGGLLRRTRGPPPFAVEALSAEASSLTHDTDSGAAQAAHRGRSTGHRDSRDRGSLTPGPLTGLISSGFELRKPELPQRAGEQHAVALDAHQVGLSLVALGVRAERFT